MIDVDDPGIQTVIFWAPAVEMVLTGSSGNGSLLGWELGPLRQSAKLWLHDAGITHIHELVRRCASRKKTSRWQSMSINLVGYS